MSQGLSMPGGDPAALEQYAALLETAAKGTASLSASSRQVTGDIRTSADWTGSAADGYTAFTGNLSLGVANMESPLTRIASAVRDYAGSLRAAQQQVAAYSAVAQTADATRRPADVASAMAAESDATVAVTAQQAAGDRAAAAVRAATSEMENPFGPHGPVRGWIEKIHAPWDVLAADAPLGRIIAGRVLDYVEAAEEVRENLGELPGLLKKSYAELEESMREAGASEADLDEETLDLLKFMDGTRKLDAAWLEDAAAAGRTTNIFRGVGLGSDLLAIAGDYFTIRKPEDGGAMGVVDQSMAGANAAAAGVDAGYMIAGIVGSTAEIPVAGEVVLVGTGVYLGGDYLYHHWTPFRDVCNDIGHATVAGADAVGHAAVSGAKEVWHGITSIF
jgi:hypothetical protein